MTGPMHAYLLGVILSVLPACTPPTPDAATMNTDPDAELHALPLTVLLTERTDASLPLVLYLSGDGGWNAFSDGLGKSLAAAGFPVVGLDALRYFRKSHPPQQVANDLAALMHHYAPPGLSRPVVLIGYSFGASVMPFAYNALPDSLKQRVRSVVILSPSEHADFRIHLRNLLALDGSEKYPVAPQLARMHNASVLCLLGDGETAGWLSGEVLPPSQVVTLPGGHHYDHDYPLLTQVIVKHLTTLRP